MKKDLKMYGTLFTSTFLLSACTFGGGYVIVPLMRKKFVEELHFIEEQEMLDMIAIAQASPGALAVNASIIIGYRCAGLKGALVTVLGTVLPPLLILSLISYFYEAFSKIRVIQILLFGMRSGVAAIVCDVVWTMAKEIIDQKDQIYVIIMLAAFVLHVIFQIHLLWIIFGCGAAGLLISCGRKGKSI